MRTRWLASIVMVLALGACVAVFGLEPEKFESVERDICTRYAKLCGPKVDGVGLELSSNTDECVTKLKQRYALPESDPKKPSLNKYAENDCRSTTTCDAFLECALAANVVTSPATVCAADDGACAADTSDAGVRAWRCCNSPCVSNTCLSAWGCLGKPQVPPAMPGVNHQVSFVLKNPVTMTFVRDVKVKACEKLDIQCAAGTQEQTPDVNGRVTFTLRDGYDGFIRADEARPDAGSARYLPTAVYFNPPLNAAFAAIGAQVPVFTEEGFAQIGATLGATVDFQNLGSIVGAVTNCKTAVAAQTKVALDDGGFASDASDASTYALYFVNNFPTPAATETDVSGSFAFVNVVPGLRQITASRTGGDRIGTVTVNARPGTIVFTLVPPTP